MKTLTYKTLLLLLTPAIVFCGHGEPASPPAGRHTKQKKISREFKVSPNDLLKIKNSYGNIDITTWEQNVVSIEVIVKVNGNDEQKVDEKLKEIDVEFQQTSEGVSARTLFSKDNSSSWWSSLFGSDSNLHREVNYIVKAPASNNVDLDNDYGHIFIDKLNGNAKISCDYGRIDAGRLNGPSNTLSFDYSRNSHFGYINKAVINADYSEFVVDDAKSLTINADYTTSSIRRVEFLKFNCDYGSLRADKVKRISGTGDYLTTKFGEVHQSVDLNLDYGSLSIAKLVKGAGDVNIKTDYTSTKIGYAKDHPFRFTVNTSYGSVKGLENLQINKQNQSSSSRSYSGYHLENSGGTVRIDASYAGITFEQQ